MAAPAHRKDGQLRKDYDRRTQFFEQSAGPMRIVTVLNSLGMGGAEKLALAVAERMAERGHTVALLVLMPLPGVQNARRP